MDANIPKLSIKDRLALLQLDHLTKPKPPEKFRNGNRISYLQTQNGKGGNHYQDQRQVIPTTQPKNPTISRPLLQAVATPNGNALKHQNSNQSQKTSWQHDNATTPVRSSSEALFLQANQRQRRHTGHPSQTSVPFSFFHNLEIKNAAPPRPPTYSISPISNIPLTSTVNTLLSRSIIQEKVHSYEATRDIPKTNNTNLPGSCYACIDYSMADAHAAKFSRHSVTSIDELAHSLTFPFQDPVLKARAIFSWFFDNIVYDTKSYFGGNIKCKEPEETLRTGLAVCQGFAELYQKLGQYAGLEVIVISGHGKGYGYSHPGGSVPSFSSNHAWNAVKLNGKWKLIDPCWGAGHINESLRYEKCFKPKYFTQSPEVFRLQHFPTNPDHQLCSGAMSWEEYITMKEGPKIYTGFNEKGFNDAELLPNHKRIPSGQPTKFVVKSRCQHHQIKPEDRYVLLLSIDRKDTPLRMEVEGAVWSVVIPSLNRGSVTLYYVDKLGGHSAKGITLEEYEASKTRMGASFTGMAQWEVY